MVRCSKLRNFLREFAESPKIEKVTFVLPFLVIIVDIILIEHAIRINEHYIIVLTTLLFFLSLIEILVVIREIHDHRKNILFDETLTITLDDFIIEGKKKNVKETVQEFIELYPKYKNYRNKIYHITCDIMDAHKKKGR
jgi:hypothetical protein